MRQFRRPVRRSGEHDYVRAQLVILTPSLNAQRVRPDLRSLARAHASHSRAQQDSFGADLLGEDSRQRVESLHEGAQAAGAPGLLGFPDRPDEASENAAVLLLEFHQHGKCGAGAQTPGISRVHARYEGGDQISQRLLSEAPTHESGQRLLARALVGPHPWLSEELQLCSQAEQLGGEQSARPHGGGMQFSAVEDVAGEPAVGRDQLSLQANLPDQVEHLRRALETVWSHFAEETVLVVRLDHAADDVRRLQHDYVQPAPLQPVRAGESRDACTDHYHSLRHSIGWELRLWGLRPLNSISQRAARRPQPINLRGSLRT